MPFHIKKVEFFGHWLSYRVDLFRGSPLPISKTAKQNWMKFWLQVAQNISETFANFDHKMSHHFWCMSAERCQLMGNIDWLQLMNQLTVSPQIMAANTQNRGLSAAPKKVDEVAWLAIFSSLAQLLGNHISWNPLGHAGRGKKHHFHKRNNHLNLSADVSCFQLLRFNKMRWLYFWSKHGF